MFAKTLIDAVFKNNKRGSCKLVLRVGDVPQSDLPLNHFVAFDNLYKYRTSTYWSAYLCNKLCNIYSYDYLVKWGA